MPRTPRHVDDVAWLQFEIRLTRIEHGPCIYHECLRFGKRAADDQHLFFPRWVIETAAISNGANDGELRVIRCDSRISDFANDINLFQVRRREVKKVVWFEINILRE